MKRHRTLIPLSRYHRRILMVALMCKYKAPEMKGYPTESLEKAAYLQDFYDQELQHHFQLEMDELFHMVKGRDDLADLLIGELNQQRAELKRWVEELSESLDLDEQLDRIGHYLEAHIRKEERELFQRIQEILDEDDMEKLRINIYNRMALEPYRTALSQQEEPK